MSRVTPMIQQYLEIKENYQDAILFYRMGDFYEMFFEDAVVASQQTRISPDFWKEDIRWPFASRWKTPARQKGWCGVK